MYKCKQCQYFTSRLFDLRRHERRKKPCNTRITGPNNADIPGQNGGIPGQNGGILGQNGGILGQNGGIPGQNGGIPGENGGILGQNGGILESKNVNLTCEQCKKTLSCAKSLTRHQKSCRQIPNINCPRCYKTFSSRDVRNRHLRTVQCIPLGSASSQQISIINTTNTTNNTTNNINNVNIQLNFGEEVLDKLCKQPDYIQRMEDVVRLGKYALPQHISDIYFNDTFPMNKTIMKTRHNDRFVKIKTGDNEWNLRAMDDVYKILTERMESYMTPYFAHVEKQMERVYDEDRNTFKKMTRRIREFGHKVLWLDWKCDDIRQIGVELKEPYCENERHRRIQEMKTLLLEHVYDKTREILCLK